MRLSTPVAPAGAVRTLRCVAVVVGAMALAACDSETECDRLFAAEQWEAAAEACVAEHGLTGSPRAAVNAADALVHVKRFADAIAWAGKAAGTEQEARGWYLTAVAHYQAEDPADLLAAALDRAIAAGERGHADVVSDAYYLRYLSTRRQGNLRQALEAASEAGVYAKRIGDRSREFKANAGLFVSLRDIGNIQDATWALERVRATADPDNKQYAGLILQYEGQLQKAAGNLALTRDAYERALVPAVESEFVRLERALHLELVEINLDLGDADKARHHLGEAERIFGATHSPSLAYFTALMELHDGDPEGALRRLDEVLAPGDLSKDWEWEIRHLAGRCAVTQGHLDDAARHFERAVEILESMRGEIGLDDCKDWMIGEKREPYEALFRLEAGKDRAMAALSTLERAKARSFLDALVASYQDASPGDSSDDGIADDDTRRRDALTRVRGLDEVLSAVSQSPVVDTRPIEDVLADLGSRRALVYFGAGDEAWLIALTRRTPVARRLALPAAELRARLRRFAARPADAALAEELGTVLLPEGTLPEAGSRLYVVADRDLGAIPFGALRRGGRFLVEDFVISYVPSRNALLRIENRPAARNDAAVVLGDPGGDLPGAEREARDVARIVGATPVVGADAGREALRGASGGRLLHVATHAGLGPRGAWLGLADGRLTADELVRSGPGADVVVLASCASAAKEGPGMWGSLSAAFLISGSRTVVASLWSIEDDVARNFALQFYEQGGDRDPAGALARAQRALITRGAEVGDWAPFVAMGSNSVRDTVH